MTLLLRTFCNEMKPPLEWTWLLYPIAEDATDPLLLFITGWPH